MFLILSNLKVFVIRSYYGDRSFPHISFSRRRIFALLHVLFTYTCSVLAPCRVIQIYQLTMAGTWYSELLISGFGIQTVLLILFIKICFLWKEIWCHQSNVFDIFTRKKKQSRTHVFKIFISKWILFKSFIKKLYIKEIIGFRKFQTSIYTHIFSK